MVSRAGQLLVIRRSRDVVAPRTFCFPGGGIEAGESEPEALVCEFFEELGSAIEPQCCLWRSLTPWNVDLAWWSAKCDATQPLKPNPAEVESVHWFSPAEMLELPELLASNRSFLERIIGGEIRLAD